MNGSQAQISALSGAKFDRSARVYVGYEKKNYYKHQLFMSRQNMSKYNKKQTLCELLRLIASFKMYQINTTLTSQNSLIKKNSSSAPTKVLFVYLIQLHLFYSSDFLTQKFIYSQFFFRTTKMNKVRHLIYQRRRSHANQPQLN